MKFKNETEDPIKVRTGEHPIYVWKTIRPGEEADIASNEGANTRLTCLESLDSSEGNPEEDAVFHKKLTDIKGVGKKSADDILAQFKTEEKLIEAMNNEEEIHNNDRINDLVYDNFEENE